MLLMFDSVPHSSASTFSPTFRVKRNSKLIATVTRGVIRPKRRLTKEENAGIVAFAVTAVYDGLQDYPAIQKRVADAFSIKGTRL